MSLQRTIVGALAFTVARGNSAAAAFLDCSFLDLVGFIQHSVKGSVSRNSEVRLEASSGDTPLSLLAVDTAASTKWYEDSSEDESLVRKLADRAKASEEKEEELAAIAKAKANNSGAAFLSQTGSFTALSAGKRDTRQWLSQTDLDHIAADEVELVELASKLQRIAAEVELIAKHQLEFGKRMGLPDPTIERFEVNDKVEIQIAKGHKHAGRWIKATVKSYNAKTNRYTVHIPSIQVGNQDMGGVGPRAIRRDEESFREADYQPAALSYQAGEQAQIKVKVGKNSDGWVKCKIKSNGTEADTYNVHIPDAPKGHKDMSDIPAKSLRKSNVTTLFTQYDVDGDGLLTSLEFNIALKEKANQVNIHSTESDQIVSEKALFAAGEEAEVLTESLHAFEEDEHFNSTWVPCTVVSDGAIADSYNLFVPSYIVGFQYLANTPVDRLRKVGVHREAQEQKVSLIPSFVDHEVLSPRGLYKNKWVPCQLKRKAPDDTYTVWMPFGVKQGHNTVGKIPESRIRVRRTCGPGYDDIFMGDVMGGDQFGRLRSRKDSVEACADDCSRRYQCLSFEWVAETQVCSLNKVQNPNVPPVGEQMFCRRTEIPTAPSFIWHGPLLGQPLEFLMSVGDHAGEWHACTVTAFGTAPDTYTVNASVDFMGGADNFTSLPEVPVKYLRYSEDKPVPSSEKWEPPQGAAAVWVPTNETTANSTKPKKTESSNTTKQQIFLVTNRDLKEKSEGLLFRGSKNLTNTISATAFANWGSFVVGFDEGDGWVRVGQTYLPTVLRGLMVLTPKINGEPGEQVQVRRKDGAWVPGTIRSVGDQPNTFNVKLLRGSAGKFLANLPAWKMRKEISVPSVAPVRRPRAVLVATTLPPVASAKSALAANSTAVAIATTTAAPAGPIITEADVDAAHSDYQIKKWAAEALEKEGSIFVDEANKWVVKTRAHYNELKAQLEAQALTSTTTTTTSSPNVTEFKFEQFVQMTGQKQTPVESKKDKLADLLEQELNATGGEGKLFLIDNRMLKHSGPGLSYRESKRLDNSKGRDAFALWGTYVVGIDEGDGWIKVKEHYLPTTVKGIPVITLKVSGGEGEIVQVQQDDGYWAHGTIRSKGDWPETFNVHVMDNTAGYDLDNVPVRRIRRDLAATPEHKAEVAALKPPLSDLEQAVAAEEVLPLTGDLGKDLPDGEFRPNMTAEVKINAGPQAGSWVRCRVVDRGDILDTYNLYVPSAPRGYQDMKGVPSLAMRKLSAAPASAEQTKPNFVEGRSIDGEVGESVEVMVRKGPRVGQWLPAVVVSEGTVPDSYNIRLPGERPGLATHKDVFNVPGHYLRKSKVKVVINQDMSYPTFVPGEEAQIVMVTGRDSVFAYNVTVLREGEFVNTYDCNDTDGIVSPGVHAKFMRKKTKAVAETTTVTTTTTLAPAQEPSVLNMKTIMQVIMAMRSDLTPVFSSLASIKAKHDLKLWKGRSAEWNYGCTAEDRQSTVLRMEVLGKVPSEMVLKALPEECHIEHWAEDRKDVIWDELAACFEAATGASRECANCPVRFLLTASQNCLARCGPMVAPCSADEEGKICATKTSHCLECLQEPAAGLLQCVDAPNVTDAMASLRAVTASAKAGKVDVEGSFKSKLDPDAVVRANHLAFLGRNLLGITWKAIMEKA